jgi:hypothetical protein
VIFERVIGDHWQLDNDRDREIEQNAAVMVKELEEIAERLELETAAGVIEYAGARR